MNAVKKLEKFNFLPHARTVLAHEAVRSHPAVLIATKCSGQVELLAPALWQVIFSVLRPTAVTAVTEKQKLRKK